MVLILDWTWRRGIGTGGGSDIAVADWRDGGKEIIMKIFILFVAIIWGLVLTTEPALSQQCTSQTYIINGKMVICQTCGNMTTCF